MLPELEALNRIRLDENLTYERLARQIGVRGPTLQRLLTQRRHKPYDRTLHKIRLYLDRRAAEPKPRVTKRRRSAA